MDAWMNRSLELLEEIAKNTKSTPLPQQPPVEIEKWENVYTADFSGMPQNTEMPNALGDPEWTPIWNPFVAGTGSADGNRNNASVQISNYELICKIWDTWGRDVGARAFIADFRQWIWWGTKFEDKVARIKAAALYPNKFDFNNGEKMYLQTFFEFKTLDTAMTAIGVFVHKGEDGKLYHYLSLNGQTFGLDQQTDPLVFGESLDYELIVEFSRKEDAKVTFKYKNTVIEGTGRTLNKKNGQGGGAFLLYSNGITGNAEVRYSNITIDRKVA